MGKLKGIVRANTGPREWNGQIQIGFSLKDNPDKWYNMTGEEAGLKEIKDTLLKKGNEIEFNFDNGKVLDIKVITQAKEGGWEEDIVDFETLLSAAHEKKISFSIKTECLHVDLEKKYALFKASVETETEIFQGHGDATVENVTGEHIKPHFIRMAETRAIVRALRWYTNNAACAEEEKSNSSAKKERPKKK